MDTYIHTHIRCPSFAFCIFTDLVNATSKQFDGGTSLHIAAANLSLQAARTLVSIYTKLSAYYIDCFIRVFNSLEWLYYSL